MEDKDILVRFVQCVENNTKAVDKMSDIMQAVINNYLLTPPTDEAVEEFNAMQLWRFFAKQVAHEAIGDCE